MYFVITSPTCAYCRVAKQHLVKANKEFVEVNAFNPEPAQAGIVEAFRATGIKSLPVVFHQVHDEVLVIGNHVDLKNHLDGLQKMESSEEG